MAAQQIVGARVFKKVKPRNGTLGAVACPSNWKTRIRRFAVPVVYTDFGYHAVEV